MNILFVQGCELYSDEFTEQTFGVCMKTYKENYHGLDSSQCRVKCLEFPGCGSYEIASGNCYISKWKEKYIQPMNLEHTLDCVHFTRNCMARGW